jgi:hypothetical protein
MTKLYEDDDDKDILRDGERLRVPLFAMDAAQRDLARMLLTDAHGRPAGHAPGYVFSAASVSDPRDAAYAEHTAYLADAWRGVQRAEIARAPAAGDAHCDAYAAYETRLLNAWRGT